jgi:glycerol-3-phosphate O-acyltransferase/dihydroxyacetone phosphate acyltransferase
MAPYRLLRGLLRLSVRAFFRRIEVVGLEHVPETGAVVFFGNHPNSLLDPALISCFCGRVVRFVAKDVLFRSPLLRLPPLVLGFLEHRRFPRRER